MDERGFDAAMSEQPEIDLDPTPGSKTMSDLLQSGTFDTSPGAKQLAEAAPQLLGELPRDGSAWGASSVDGLAGVACLRFAFVGALRAPTFLAPTSWYNRGSLGALFSRCGRTAAIVPRRRC